VQRFRDTDAVRVPPLPDWWPGDERPLVYVTFGSVAAQVPPAVAVYRKALEAVADVEARVLLTVGVGAEVELGQVPPNVRVERWVPQADVLPHASIVVGHGGAGTTLGALAAGVPLVIVPLFADQDWNAVQTARAGAGVVASLDGIRGALDTVTADGSYTNAARAIAGEMRRLPPVDAYVESVERR